MVGHPVATAPVLTSPRRDARQLPQFTHVQNKVGQLGIASDLVRVLEHLCVQTWPIDIDSLFEGINQPRQLSTVRDVFKHLVFEWRQIVRARTNLDYEIRAQRSKSFLFIIRECAPTLATYPRSVRRTPRLIW